MENYTIRTSSRESSGAHTAVRALNKVDTSSRKLREEVREGFDLIGIDFRSKQHISKEISKHHLIQLCRKVWGLSMNQLQATQAMIVCHKKKLQVANPTTFSQDKFVFWLQENIPLMHTCGKSRFNLPAVSARRNS